MSFAKVFRIQTNLGNVSIIGDKQIAKRRNENFYRISARDLVALIQSNQVPAQDSTSAQEESKESIYALMGAGGGGAQPMQAAAASNNAPVADNAAVNTVNANQIGISSDSRYLIVDLRDKAEWTAWHIKESYSLPLMMINQDRTIPEVHRFKNVEGKMIICYVQDERNGILAARAMVDRGYENTYLLTGGIEKFIEDYHSLVEGNNIPPLVEQTPARGQKPAGRGGRGTR